MIEVERIRELADRIEGMRHLPYDMIGNGIDAEDQVDDPENLSFNMACVAAHEKQGCGTVACVAGHAYLMAREVLAPRVDSRIVDEAADFLGLDNDQADGLFFPTGILDRRAPEGQFTHIPLEDFEPRHAVQTLRAIAKHAESGEELDGPGIVEKWTAALDEEGFNSPSHRAGY